jgi:hypothetical protein
MWSTDSMTTRTHCWYVINWFYDNSYSLLTYDQLILWQLVLIADMWSTDSMTTRTHCWYVINWLYDWELFNEVAHIAKHISAMSTSCHRISWSHVSNEYELSYNQLITYQQWVRVVIESVDHMSAMSTSCHRISWSDVSNEYDLS